MAPKKSISARSNGPARRGRSSTRGRGRGGKNHPEHARVLSDITEESASQIQTESVSKQPKIQDRTVRGSKKRSLEEEDHVVTPAKRETRAQTAKRIKQNHPVDEEPVPVDTSISGIQQQDQKQTQSPVADDFPKPVSEAPLERPASHIPESYIPSLNLLFFVQLAGLDADADTETITLNLINLTLAPENWHLGLSGLVQPVACFLVASLLTRKQNLVEDIAASVQMFGLEYQQLVEGYRLLWEWRENMSEAVGVYAERLAELPEPELLLGQVEYDLNSVSGYEVEEDVSERPEPERWAEAAEA